MTRTAKELLEQALSLDESDRATLAALLIESLEGELDEGFEAAWSEEVRRRAAELDAGRVAAIPWEEVRKRLSRSARGRARP
jgi:putative addiction module component (TIGR02574 family)